jgi:hypothetical protein
MTLIAITNYHRSICWMICFITFARLSYPYWLWRQVITFTKFRIRALGGCDCSAEDASIKDHLYQVSLKSTCWFWRKFQNKRLRVTSLNWVVQANCSHVRTYKSNLKIFSNINVCKKGFPILASADPWGPRFVHTRTCFISMGFMWIWAFPA